MSATPNEFNTCHCMIDIETLGVLETAPILSIGAVLFDPTQFQSFAYLRSRALLVHIDVSDAIKTCGPAEPDTLKWWMSQPEAMAALKDRETVTVKEGLKKLWQYTHSRGLTAQPEWLKKAPVPTSVWANSPSFDIRIINHACRQVGASNPFHFANDRCVRTIKALAWPNEDAPRLNDGTAHDAADDAVAQALLVQVGYSRLGLGRSDVSFM